MTQFSELIEESDYWVIPLNDRTVTQCRIDHAFGLEFWESNNNFSISIEGVFVFKASGNEYKFDPEHSTTLGPALAVLNKEIRSALAYKDGSLELNFSEGISVYVPIDPNCEAWTINGGKGLRLVCLPGGNLAIWQPD